MMRHWGFLIGLAVAQAGPITFHSHNDMESVHPPSLAKLPGLSIPSQGPAVESSKTSNLPVLTPNTTTLQSCAGETISLEVFLPANFTRNESDWIGIYSPADTVIDEVVPVKKISILSTTPDYLDDPSVALNLSYSVDLINMRSDYRFVFFSADDWIKSSRMDDVAEAVAVSESSSVDFYSDTCYRAGQWPRVVPVIDEDSGKQVTGEWEVVWTTNHDVSHPVLYYAYSKDDLDCSGATSSQYKQKAEATTFTEEDLCGAPAATFGYRDPGQSNRARVANIPASRTIHYCFDTIIDRVYSFTAPPATVDVKSHPEKVEETRIMAYGDMGRGTTDDTDSWHEYGSPAVYNVQNLQAEIDDVDGIFHIGDISYAVGFQASWDLFLSMISPVSSKVSYMINQGNHEYDWNTTTWVPEDAPLPAYTGSDSGGECGVSTTTHFPLPLWWSSDVGLFHVIAMCTEVNFTTGSAQWEWIKQDLASIDRRKTPWVLFGGHRPGYIDSNWWQDQESQDLFIEHLEPLLVQHNVSLCIWGHNHAYQRLCASENSICVQHSTGSQHRHSSPTVPVHMVIGTGGGSFTKNAMNVAWDEHHFYQFGYARITAHNESLLEWEFLNISGVVSDVMSIEQDFDAILASTGGLEHHSHSSGDSSMSSGKLAAIIVLAVVVALGIGVAITVAVMRRRSASEEEAAVNFLKSFSEDILSVDTKDHFTRLESDEEDEMA